jgi:hypothetical protein
MAFIDPREKPPEDGQRCRFKVTGDPKSLGIDDPATGTFHKPDTARSYAAGFLRYF